VNYNVYRYTDNLTTCRYRYLPVVPVITENPDRWHFQNEAV